MPSLSPATGLGQIEAMSFGTAQRAARSGAVGCKEGQAIAIVKLDVLRHLAQLNPVAATFALTAESSRVPDLPPTYLDLKNEVISRCRPCRK